MNYQTIVIAIVLIGAVAYALKRLLSTWREAQSGCYGCKGCALKEQMMKAKRKQRVKQANHTNLPQKHPQNACWQKK